MTTKRHSLTASEHQEVQIYIKNTNLSYLNPHYKQMFEGIAENYSLDGCLSDAQIKVLKKSKYVSDMKKRELNLNYSTRSTYDTDINQKLDVVFNPIGG
jgi:hypothetical protein